jgi:hypothetical protein
MSSPAELARRHAPVCPEGILERLSAVRVRNLTKLTPNEVKAWTQYTLWSRIDMSGGLKSCWLWKGGHNVHGYGVLSVKRRSVYAHRLAYEIACGPVPKGLELDHLCRVRNCVNPGHMEAVTHKENVKRSLFPSIVNRTKTHCKWGHLLDDSNIYRPPKAPAKRQCKQCIRRRTVERNLRRDAAP